MTTNPYVDEAVVRRLEEMYFVWLKLQINFNYRRVRNSNAPQFTMLTMAMWEKPFPWVVPYDENRIQDGFELRYHFLQDENYALSFRELQDLYGEKILIASISEFRARPCRILEVLIALSRRLEFMEGSDAGWWAWKLITNLELHKMKDPISRVKKRRLDEALDALVWRTYDRDGSGGFFPLAHPEDDQRKIEIWYQMAAYLAEFGHP
jgi:hypothetical protein